jgi:hypothetical protein
MLERAAGRIQDPTARIFTIFARLQLDHDPSALNGADNLGVRKTFRWGGVSGQFPQIK